MSRFQHNIMS